MKEHSKITMMIRLFLNICSIVLFAFCANALTVENVRAVQRNNSNMVDIWYDLVHQQGGMCHVDIKFTSSKATPSVVNVSGDVGDFVEIGKNKKIVWNAGKDFKKQHVSDMICEVMAQLQAKTDAPKGMVWVYPGTASGRLSVHGKHKAKSDDEYYISWYERDEDFEVVTGSSLTGFFMDRTEVNSALWRHVYKWAVTHGYSFEKSLADYSGGENYPQRFTSSGTPSLTDLFIWCNARSEMDGKFPCYYDSLGEIMRSSGNYPTVITNGGYRLPTSSEWRYAASGGSSFKLYPWGNDISFKYATYIGCFAYKKTDSDNEFTEYFYSFYPSESLEAHLDKFPNYFHCHPRYGRHTAPVGSFCPNHFGLYDMSGNLCEATWNPAAEVLHRALFLGGSWNDGCRDLCIWVPDRFVNCCNHSFDWGFRTLLCPAEGANRIGDGVSECSRSFTIDTANCGIADVISECFGGEYGAGGGKNAVFLNGVYCPVEICIEMDDDFADEVNYWLVNDVATTEPKCTVNMGEIPVGGKLEVKAVMKSGTISKPFRANIDMASSLFDHGSKIFHLKSNADGNVVYSTGEARSVSFFGALSDYYEVLGQEYSLDVVPSVTLEETVESSSGIRKWCVGGGAGKSFKEIGKLGSGSLCLELRGGPQWKWNKTKQKWVDAGGSFGGLIEGDVTPIEVRFPATANIVYFSLGFEGSVEFSAVWDESGSIQSSISANPLLGVIAALGAGHKMLAAVEVYGSGGFLLDAQYPNPSTCSYGMKLSFGANAYLGGMKTQFSPWNYTKMSGGGAAMNGMRFAAASPVRLDELEWSVMPRDYAQRSVRPRLTMLSTDANATTEFAAADECTVVSGEYPLPGPSVTCCGNTDYLLYLRDNASRGASDRTELMLRTGVSNVWNAAHSVWDDGTADFMVSSAALPDGGIVAAWVNLKDKLPDSPIMSDILSKMEIAVGVYDTNSCAWSCHNLTDNVCLDVTPKVKISRDGVATVMWLCNEGGSLLGTADSPSSIMYSQYKNGTWTTAGVVTNGLVSVQGFDFAENGGNGILAYAIASDPYDVSNEDIAGLYCCKLSGMVADAAKKISTQDTENSDPNVYFVKDGTISIIWNCGGKLYELRDPLNAVASEECICDRQIPTGVQMASSADGRSAIVWGGMSSDETDRYTALAMSYDNGRSCWNTPIEMNVSDRAVRNVAVGMCNDGRICTAYESVELSTNGTGVINYGSVDLRTMILRDNCDLSIVDNSFVVTATNGYASGEWVQIGFDVENKGMVGATNVTVGLYQIVDGERWLIGSVQTNLYSGIRSSLTFSWAVDERASDVVFRAEIDPDGLVEEEDRLNNRCEYIPAMPSLEIAGTRIEKIDTLNRILTAEIACSGIGTYSNETHVIFRRGSDVIGSDCVPTIKAGSSYSAGLNWNLQGLTFTSAWEVVSVDVVSDLDNKILATSDVAVMTTLDTDEDGLEDAQEEMLGTNPRSTDTDGDGFSDFKEVRQMRTDPLVANITLENPTNVVVSTGDCVGAVKIDWSSVESASTYEIWRKPSSDESEPVKIGTTTSLTYMDAQAVPNVTYAYYVKACGYEGESLLGTGVNGWMPAPLSITTDFLSGLFVRENCTAGLSVTGGVEKYSWSIDTNRLNVGYAELASATNTFTAAGVAQGWHSDSGAWFLELPWEFKLFDNAYNTIYVHAQGLVSFDSWYTWGTCDTNEFANHPAIAAMWNEMTTEDGDVYIETKRDAITIRWNGNCVSDGKEVDFAITLERTGKILFSYGDGNANSGLIGLSRGDGTNVIWSTQNGQPDNCLASDIVFLPLTGLPDGLTLSNEGIIYGTAPKIGQFNLPVQVVDGNGAVAHKVVDLQTDTRGIFVRSDAVDDSGDGLSWETAKKSIGAAAELAIEGDIVHVADGVYGPIDLSKCTNIFTIISVNGPLSTIIDGGFTNRCATLNDSMLEGFTLRYGMASSSSWEWEDLCGGGAFNGVLNRCIIEMCYAICGGGAYRSELHNCIVRGNSASSSGGAAYECSLNGCTIVDNAGTCAVAAGSVDNSIIWGNGSNPIQWVDDFSNNCCDDEDIVLEYADAGNITNNPSFVDFDGGDYRIRSCSPCIDGGDAAYAYGNYDISGALRIQNQTVDMGAYEGGVIGNIVSVKTKGHGTVDQRLGIVADGGSFSTQWQGQPVKGITTNGVPIEIKTSLAFDNITSDIAVEIEFDGLYVDAKHDDDTGDGLSWATAKKSLQDAIDLAYPNDVIYVEDGEYSPISVAAEGVTITSKNGAKVTFIDAHHEGRCAMLADSCKLIGFMLRNGCCEIGGGVYGGDLEDCILKNNEALDECGGGAYSSTLSRCLIWNNYADYGGGAYDCQLDRCTIVGNVGECGGGASYSTLNRCIVWGNTAYEGMSIYGGTASDSCLQGISLDEYDMENVITNDPCFVDFANGDFRIRSGSPSADAVMGFADEVVTGHVIRVNTKGHGYASGKTFVVQDNGAVEVSFSRLPASVAVDGVVEPAAVSLSLSDIDSDHVVDVTFDGVYVDATNGNDTADGLSRTTAKRTIQAAIDICLENDVVNVADGTYLPFTADDHILSIVSENGAQNTFIDGGGTNRCALLTGCELVGFTICNGYAENYGINARDGYGGGVYRGKLENCLVVGNLAEKNGGATYFTDLEQCTIVGNSVFDLYSSYGIRGGSMHNSILWDTTMGDYTSCSYSFVGDDETSCPEGMGVICGNPKFKDAENGDYHLRFNSPCRHAAEDGISDLGIFQYEMPSSLPSAVVRVAASDGISMRFTTVAWDAVSDAEAYHVYRAEKGLPDNEILVGECGGTAFEDASGEKGKHYLYRVCAVNGLGEGGMSDCDEGWLAPQLVVTTAVLPEIKVGTETALTLMATGGVPPYAWSTATNDYNVTTSSLSDYANVGAAQGWQADDSCWSFELPFDFPFYGSKYRTAYVNSNGTLAFDESYSGWNPNEYNLKSHAMIAVWWSDLTTSSGDIYVLTNADRAVVRWDANSWYGDGSQHFAVTLHTNGVIECSYDSACTFSSSSEASVALSAGDGIRYQMIGKDETDYKTTITPAQHMPEGLSLLVGGNVVGIVTQEIHGAFTVLVADSEGNVAYRDVSYNVAADTTGEPQTPDQEFWNEHPEILEASGGDPEVAKLAQSPGKSGKGKFKPNGEPMKVWEDYVAGTDPEDEDDQFTAKVEMVDGKPVITWEPALNDTATEKGVKTGKRTYRTLGKKTLGDEMWTEIKTGEEVNYNFFKVTVEMP